MDRQYGRRPTTKLLSKPRRGIQAAAAAAIATGQLGVAMAAPVVTAVYTDRGAGGTPTHINIVGSGFSCQGCESPRVRLGGLSLVIQAHSAKVITAVLPQPHVAGNYALEVTSGPAQRREVTVFSLSIASPPAGASSAPVAATPVPRTTARPGGPVPSPSLRVESNLWPRSSGPVRRSAGNASRQSATGAKPLTISSSAKVAGADLSASADSSSSGALPEYSTAYGDYALYKVSTGYFDTTTRANAAFGYGALLNTTAGSYNNAFGFYSLYANTDGGYNNAFGNWALVSNDTGVQNTALGHEALASNTSGSWNTAIGAGAGGALTTGNHNISIGSPGVAGESGAIRIGTPGAQTSAFVAGISGNDLGGRGTPVLIDPSTGQLGTGATAVGGKYSPRVVTVECDGSGSRLATALAELNPVADVYDVTISGHCPEAITLENFTSITLRSADPAAQATIGNVMLNSGSHFVKLQDIIVRVDSSVGSFVTVASAGRLDMMGVTLECADNVDGEGCYTAIHVIGNADLRAYGTKVVGNFSSSSGELRGQLSLDRGAVAILAAVGGAPAPDYCQPFAIYQANRGSTLRIIELGTATCATGRINSWNGSEVVYHASSSSKVAAVNVRNGSAFGTKRSSGTWFQSVSCTGAADLVTYDTSTTPMPNYCYEPLPPE